MSRLLDRHYYSLRHPESFTTKTGLKNALKGEIDSKTLNDWSAGQDTITEYAPARKIFLRRPTVAHEKNAIWAMDTAFFLQLEKFNKGYKYLVIIVDILTRYVYGVPLKSKKPAELVEGFKKLPSKPTLAAYVDAGGEYLSAFRRFLEQQGIQLWTSRNEVKSSIAERYIQSFKKRLYRYLHYTKSKDWLSVYQKILDNMNSTYNRSIKMAPAECVSKEDQKEAFINLYGDQLGFTSKQDDLETGDQVKISHLRHPFRKSYNANFTHQTYTLEKKFPKENQSVYTLRANDDNDIVTGKFYRQELKKSK
jgi:transposase InsO family protein